MFLATKKSSSSEKDGSNKSFQKIIMIISLSAGVVAGVFIFNSNYQQIVDTFKANFYEPSSEIKELVSSIEFKDDAKKVFFASNPQIENKDSFASKCINRAEKTAVLGCYKDSEIHVLDVKDPQLNGIKEVTAAHEFLHAIWARMDNNTRKDLGKKLTEEYERIKTPKFEELMKNYKETEPEEMENELHSLIGTQEVEISADLEKHYARFFNNRKKIANFYKQYNSKFTKLENEIENLNNQLPNLKKEIDDKTAQYNSQLEQLDKDILNFNQRANNGSFNSQQQFDRERHQLVLRKNKIDSYNKEINESIDRFNVMRQRLLDISIQNEKLYDSITTNLKTSNKI